MRICLFSLSLCFAGLLVSGCATETKVELLEVSGKITYKTQPVGEGVVTFEDSASGLAASGKLAADGQYHLQLAPGNYAVSVVPPMEMVDSGPNSPPAERYRNVTNIPEKVRSLRTSGLTAAVTPGKTTFDFDLQ